MSDMAFFCENGSVLPIHSQKVEMALPIHQVLHSFELWYMNDN